LMMVHRQLFNKPDPCQRISMGEETFSALFMGLSEHISSWLSHAELHSNAFQQWGTLPWVAWPTRSRHALLNGGTALLRLEADTVADGAIAMTLFPASKKPSQRSFKIRVDQLCEAWGLNVEHTAVLPSMGFTTVAPAAMDEMGGMPADVKNTPESILLSGNGRAHVSSEHCGGTAWHSESSVLPKSPYRMTAGDTFECVWGKGFIRLEVDGEILFQVKEPSIVGPPKKPIFGIVDCCYAACRVTLVA